MEDQRFTLKIYFQRFASMETCREVKESPSRVGEGTEGRNKFPDKRFTSVKECCRGSLPGRNYEGHLSDYYVYVRFNYIKEKSQSPMRTKGLKSSSTNFTYVFSVSHRTPWVLVLHVDL